MSLIREPKDQPTTQGGGDHPWMTGRAGRMGA